MVGMLHFWGLTVDTISCVNIVLAIGLCVDYSAHIAHAFIVEKGSSSDKAAAALASMGPAILNGGVTTFLALVLLGFSESHVFAVFFKVFFLTVVFGLFHGLVFLPVVLSLLRDRGDVDVDVDGDGDGYSKTTASTSSDSDEKTSSPSSSPSSSSSSPPPPRGVVNKAFVAVEDEEKKEKEVLFSLHSLSLSLSHANFFSLLSGTFFFFPFPTSSHDAQLHKSTTNYCPHTQTHCPPLPHCIFEHLWRSFLLLFFFSAHRCPPEVLLPIPSLPSSSTFQKW